MQGRVSFAREPLSSALWDEALPLLFAHWKEVAHYQDIELTPDLERYQKLEESGVIRVFTARETREFETEAMHGITPNPNGLLIGYALFMVLPHLHYRQIIQAQQDVVYIQPNQRGTMPVRFLAFCERELFAGGADIVCHHGKKAHPALGRALEHLGYDVMDVYYVKRRPVSAPRTLTLAESVEARG